tara:strand:+ start:5716 stop:6087 length:372 start_codon:yes stop_codon:yes gene_type:complete
MTLTLITIILGISSLLFLALIILMGWYISHAVMQIKNSEQFTYEIIEGIETLKESMEVYITHVNAVHDMEMFYGDETLRELIRHGKALVETFEEYKIDYFPILELEMEGELSDDNKSEPTNSE